MIRVARRDQPGFDFDVADLRETAFRRRFASWPGLLVLPHLPRAVRQAAAFGELARVLKPGGYLVTAFKAGDSQVRRGGHSTGLGVEFDVYWLSPAEMERRVTDAGLAAVFWVGRPAQGQGRFSAGISARSEILRPTNPRWRTLARQDRRLTIHTPGAADECFECGR